MVAALLGGAITAAGMLAGANSGNGALVGERGLLPLEGGETLSSTEIYDRAAPSVVAVRARSIDPGVTAFDANAGSELGVSSGSGFVLDADGRIVTNAHVVSGVTDVEVTFADGKRVQAQVIGKDEETDLAVLSVAPDGLDLEPLELGDSDGVREGDRVVALGNPTGLQATAGTGSISGAGMRVEASGEYVIDGLLETDAVIVPATSGGPLVADDGQVIGITSRLGDDTGYAVPANVARDVLTQLEDSHKVIRPWIGIRGRGTANGVQLVGVHQGGPADEAGLQPGDVVESIDDVTVRTLGGLLGEVDRHSVGDSVELSVVRSGSRGDVVVRLDERPATIR